MGIDQKRPLAGFALVTVLCAVLMTLSVARGWGLDLFHPGRPIVAAAHSDTAPRTHAPAAPTAGTPVSVPTELSPQPLGASTGAPEAKVSAHARPARAGGRSVTTTTVSTASTGDDRQAEQKADRAAERAVRKALRHAGKAQRKAEWKAEHEAARVMRKADHDAAKAARRAEHEAAKAVREAEHEAAKAVRQAEHEAAKAVRDAEKAARHP